MNFLKKLAKNRRGSALIETLVIYVAIAAAGVVVVAFLMQAINTAAGKDIVTGDGGKGSQAPSITPGE